MWSSKMDAECWSFQFNVPVLGLLMVPSPSSGTLPYIADGSLSPTLTPQQLHAVLHHVLFNAVLLMPRRE